MALADIITKIKNDAETESAQITGAAQEEAKAILEEAESQAAEIQSQGKEGAQQLEKETHDRTLSAAAHQAKFTTQGFQATLIERTFAEVEKKLSELSGDAYREFVMGRAKELPEKSGTVTVAKERKEETLAALKEAGVSTENVQEAELLGGFILETESAEYDNSVREIVRLARNTFSGDAAQTLFN